MLVIVTMLPVIMIAGIGRFHNDGAAQIRSQYGNEEELSFRLHARLLGQVGSQVSFG